MKTNFVISILVSALLVPRTLWSQEDQLRRALVFPKAGNGMSGYLTGIRIGEDDDTLVFFSGSQTQKILVGDLSRVIVLSQNRGGSGFLHGALLGTYISTLLFGQANQHPTAYLTQEFSSGGALLLTALLGIGVGGGLGALIKSGSDEDIVFDFGGNEIDKRVARRKFYELMSGESNSPNFHFSVQGGHVYTQVSKDFQNAMGSSTYNYYGTGIAEFNWLRKVQLTYSLQPDFEVGGAIQWSSEPTLSAYRYESPGPNTSLSRNATQSLKVVGYYGVCKYQPFYGTMPKQIQFVVGGGIGIVNIEYSRTVSTYTNSYDPPYNSTQSYVQDNVNDMTASAIMFGEFNLFLRESLSLGLSADYVYYPPKKVAANPSANLPEETLLGNACIGFVLGLHF
jgi:hypothetical protein